MASKDKDSTPRDPGDVLDAMIPLVPTGERELLKRLESARQSARFKPPEAHRDVFVMVAPTLFDHFPERSKLTEWQRALVDIFEGRE